MRIKELDSIRGIACLMVVLFHYTTRYSISFNTQKTTALLDFKYGGLGVSLFFMISGFVIYLSINNVKDAKTFFIKRFIRLYPIFWICMLTTFIIMNLSPIEKYHRSIGDLIFNITMIPDVFGFKRIDGVYWSLLPELMFYLAIGFTLFLKKVKYFTYICFGWLILILLNHFHDVMPLRILFNLKYGYFFIIGICFYKIKFEKPLLVNHILIFLSYAVYILNIGLSINTFFIGFFILIFYLFVYGKLKWIIIKPLIFLGKISYPLYLLHQFIGYYIIFSLLENNVSNSLILLMTPLIFTIALSFLYTEYLEKKAILFLRKKLL